MRNKFAVVVAALCAAVAPVLAQPRAVGAHLSAEAFHAVEAASQAPTLSLPMSPLLIQAADVPASTEETPATDAEASRQPAGAQAAAGARTISKTAVASKMSTQKGAAIRQASDAVAKGDNVMDGAATAKSAAPASQGGGLDNTMRYMSAMQASMDCLSGASVDQCGGDAEELKNFRASAQSAEEMFANASNTPDQNGRHQFAQVFLELNTALNHLGDAIAANDAAKKAAALKEITDAMNAGHSL